MRYLILLRAEQPPGPPQWEGDAEVSKVFGPEDFAAPTP